MNVGELWLGALVHRHSDKYLIEHWFLAAPKMRTYRGFYTFSYNFRHRLPLGVGFDHVYLLEHHVD
jgi:hypothetical protein